MTTLGVGRVWVLCGSLVAGSTMAAGCGHDCETDGEQVTDGGVDGGFNPDASDTVDGDSGTGSDAGHGGDAGDDDAADAPPVVDPFADPVPIEVNVTEAVVGTLADDVSAMNGYSFEGTAGMRVVIMVDSRDPATGAVLFDGAVTLYDANRERIARNGEALPPLQNVAQLYTVLPADGTYTYFVESCTSAYADEPDITCGPSIADTPLTYRTAVIEVSQSVYTEVLAGSAQDGSPANAVPIVYDGASLAYGPQVDTLFGEFSAPGQVHVFAFTAPTGYDLEYTRTHADFWFHPAGTGGSGAADGVTAWVTDVTGTILGRTDGGAYGNQVTANGGMHLWVPVVGGQSYYLYVRSNATSAEPGRDYYFASHHIAHYFSWSLEGETSLGTPGSNDGPGNFTEFQSLVDDGSVVILDGELDRPGDLDDYAIQLPWGTHLVHFWCGARQSGSGLRGLTVEVLDRNFQPIPGGTVSETADTAAEARDLVAPSEETNTIRFRISAESQDPEVTGRYYGCIVTRD